MNRSYLFAGAVLVALAFSVGYAAGTGGLSGLGTQSPPPAAQEDGIFCYFSPHGGCTDAVVSEIDQAQNRFKCKPIRSRRIRSRGRSSTPIGVA